jgi:hypothetical protein
MVIFRSRSFFVSKKFALPYEAERGISMSKTKTRTHQLYYEGMYWNSRANYVAWVQTQSSALKNLEGLKK